MICELKTASVDSLCNKEKAKNALGEGNWIKLQNRVKVYIYQRHSWQGINTLKATSPSYLEIHIQCITFSMVNFLLLT